MSTCISIFLDAAKAKRLIAELDSWIGTPWAHMAAEAGQQRAIKRVGGDCKTILATAYADAGFIERLEFPAHTVAPGLEADEDVEFSVTKYLQRFCDDGRMIRLRAQAEPLFTGDVLTFRWGARDHHLGACRIVANRPYVYHVPGVGRRFMLSPLSEWFAQLRSAYRLVEPEVAHG